MNPKSVVLALSGGMDSSTLLAHLLDQGHSVDALIFTYGSKHNEYENKAAQDIARHYGVPHHIIDLSGVMASFKSNLLKSGGAIPEGHYEDESMALTVVPARNIIFLSILAGHAWSVGATEIAIGIHQGDHVVYEDCRKEFFKAMDSALYLGTGGRVEISAPFVNLDKTGILGVGQGLGVPYGLTRTCYKDQPLACGKCGSCCERLSAFYSLGVADPADYENREEYKKFLAKKG